MGLVMSICVGSAIQVALVVAPLLVIRSWLIGTPMTLVFTDPLDLFAIAGTAFIVNAITTDGETTWFEGVLLCALASFFVQLWISIREANRVFAGDPWDGRGLEWSTSAPPPEYNFAVIPQVQGRDAFFDAKREDNSDAPPVSYHDIELPKNSVVGPVLGAIGAATAFGLVWHMWWLAIIGVLAIVATVIARSFARDVHRIIPADEVERTERRWLRAVAEATPIPREVELRSANQGLAEVSA
jgi:cytochrome o ubiquinol oxidase subunit 1